MFDDARSDLVPARVGGGDGGEAREGSALGVNVQGAIVCPAAAMGVRRGTRGPKPATRAGVGTAPPT